MRKNVANALTTKLTPMPIRKDVDRNKPVDEKVRLNQPLSRREQRKEERRRQRRETSKKLRQGRNKGSFLQTFRRLWGYFAGTIVALATLVGLYIAFLPRPVASRMTSLSHDDPFSTVFTLRNNGSFSLYDIDVVCHLRNVRLGRSVEIGGSDVRNVKHQLKKLEPDSPTTVPCAFNNAFRLPAPVMSADYVIEIHYGPFLLGRSIKSLSHVKRFRFVGMRDSTGNFQWLEQPVVD